MAVPTTDTVASLAAVLFAGILGNPDHDQPVNNDDAMRALAARCAWIARRVWDAAAAG